MIRRGILLKQGDLIERLQRQRASLTWKCVGYLVSWLGSSHLKKEEPLLIVDELQIQSENLWKNVGKNIIDVSDWLVTAQQMEKFYNESEDGLKFQQLSWPILSTFMELHQIIVPIYSPGASKGDSPIGYKFYPYSNSFTWVDVSQKLTSGKVDSHILILRKTLEKTATRERHMEVKALE